MRTIALCVKQVIKKHVLPLLFCKSFDDGGHDDDIDNDLYIMPTRSLSVCMSVCNVSL